MWTSSSPSRTYSVSSASGWRWSGVILPCVVASSNRRNAPPVSSLVDLPGVHAAAGEPEPLAFAVGRKMRESERSCGPACSPDHSWYSSTTMTLRYHQWHVNRRTSQPGRTRQKQRTRAALIAAARALVARGVTPTVEDAAAAAGVSRTTAYRYFPNQRAIVVAAHPEVDARSLLPDDVPAGCRARGSTRSSTRSPARSSRTSCNNERCCGSHSSPTPARGTSCSFAKVARSGGSRMRSRRCDAELPAARAASPRRSRSAARSGSRRLVWLTDVAGCSRDERGRAHALVGASDVASDARRSRDDLAGRAEAFDADRVDRELEVGEQVGRRVAERRRSRRRTRWRRGGSRGARSSAAR